ncbi:Bax inhibitor-1/YccA family protein [Pikeienuella piscinae]|uniref:Bax inhibitor-1/YccA family protein n=1 Tax=Pikeienuella piscinae TaxID=2748098 RepID=A0A7L5C2L0_9RHOB|nr:Bax inhibitor-1/YccA family protein [Pikeienuella piscinae]QIE56444.1 Bax inhibitor-1/YccA family protein [Pikeienuella piscinae]
MADYQTAIRRDRVAGADIDIGLRAYMNKVYSLMAVAMAITGVVAYVFGNDLFAVMRGQETMLVPEGVIVALFNSPLKWAVMFAPLLFVFGLAAAINKMSASTAQTVFWVFAGVMGLSISSIFALYTGVSIATTFFVTAIAFLGLSLYGYTTKRDLSGMGAFLVMGVIGLIVAMVVNIFLASSALQFAISVIGVLIFAGLTAFDTQRLKNEYVHYSQMGAEGAAYLSKGAIMGALSLYLNFLNMFMFLLQFMGAARE